MILLLRSIPLVRATRNAWRSSDVTIIRRRDSKRWDIAVLVNYLGGQAIVNLGNLDHEFNSLDIPVFNCPDSIRAISTPAALRRTLGDNYIPQYTIKDPHWHKRKGWGGDGKIFHEKELGKCAVMGGDAQKHIEGTEYRIVTVGDVIVQASRKEKKNAGYTNNNSISFDWYWCGIDGIRNNGIIPHVKDAIKNIPNWPYTMFGWDIIVSNNNNRVYAIEINTSPGVNEHTAQRIVNQIKKVI